VGITLEQRREHSLHLIGSSLADYRGRRWTMVAAVCLAWRLWPTSALLLYRPAACELVPRERRLPAFAWHRCALNVGFFTVVPLLIRFLSSQAFFFLIFLADALSSIVSNRAWSWILTVPL
jgi:hypothetical protein